MKKTVKYGGIIEARMGSSRLPGKTLKNIYGEPMIKRIFKRLSLSKKMSKLVLATSKNQIDDILVEFAKKNNIEYYRGSEINVLERVVYAAKKFQIENIIELHGDNPFLDPYLIDDCIDIYEEKKCDYISNTIKNTFPAGLRVQIFPYKLLKDVYDNIDDPAVNEHVSLYFYENPHKYKIENFFAPKILNRPDIRLTVDTTEDFKFISSIFKIIIKKNLFPHFTTKDVLQIIDDYNIPLLNKSISSKPIRY